MNKKQIKKIEKSVSFTSVSLLRSKKEIDAYYIDAICSRYTTRWVKQLIYTLYHQKYEKKS